MRWIFLILPFLLNSACLYVEGRIIQEPKDVVIPPCAEEYTAYYPCHYPDVTKTRCSN